MSDEKVDPAKLLEVARALLAKWQQDVPPGEFEQSKVGETEVARMLRFAVLAGKIASGGLGTSPEQILAIIDVIKVVQKRLKVDDRDGFFGRASKNALERLFRACDPGPSGQDGKKLGELADANIENTNFQPGDTATFCYFVSPALRAKTFDGGVPAIDLIRYAWNFWTREANIRTILVQHEEDANVVIELGHLDGAGSMLGLAHVGGPQFLGQQLTVTIDQDDSFDKQHFVVALCHEFGHILGLTHTNDPTQLMYPLINIEGGIVSPRDQDKQRVIALWGKKPEFEKAKMVPPPDFPGRAALDRLDQA